MTHSFSDPSSCSGEREGWLVCHYVNSTEQIQIVRIANIPGWQFERVVFPGQRLLFESPSDAEFEIQTERSTCATEVHRIPCDRIPCSLPS